MAAQLGSPTKAARLALELAASVVPKLSPVDWTAELQAPEAPRLAKVGKRPLAHYSTPGRQQGAEYLTPEQLSAGLSGFARAQARVRQSRLHPSSPHWCDARASLVQSEGAPLAETAWEPWQEPAHWWPPQSRAAHWSPALWCAAPLRL